MIVNSSRAALEQTGDGHFSPVCGLSENKTLVFDVARYKYPSYWCDLDRLFNSMQRIDKDT